VIYCNDIENELRHESQRLLNAQIELQNAAVQKSDLERRVRLYEAEEDDAKVKVNKEMEKLKVYPLAPAFCFNPWIKTTSAVECKC
jgi:hypothetical protein